jgi:DNA-binding MarR family transcriptional regulator
MLARLRDARLDRALRPFGLNATRHRALAVIAVVEACTMSELADFSAIDRTTMTRIVDQLVSRGLAQRSTPSQDRRQVVITLTAKGHEAYESGLEAIAEVNRLALKGVSDEVMRTIARAQETILLNLAPDADHARRVLALYRE